MLCVIVFTVKFSKKTAVLRKLPGQLLDTLLNHFERRASLIKGRNIVENVFGYRTNLSVKKKQVLEKSVERLQQI